MKLAKVKMTSRSFPEFTAAGNLFSYDARTSKWHHVASGVMTLNFVLSLKQSMDMLFAGTSHKKSRHDRREQIDHHYEISHRSRLRPLERSPGSWAFKALRVDNVDERTAAQPTDVIAVNFDVPADSERFCAHFAALQKQLTFQDSEHVKRGGSHIYSRKIRTTREFLNAIDAASESKMQLMNQKVCVGVCGRGRVPVCVRVCVCVYRHAPSRSGVGLQLMVRFVWVLGFFSSSSASSSHPCRCCTSTSGWGRSSASSTSATLSFPRTRCWRSSASSASCWTRRRCACCATYSCSPTTAMGTAAGMGALAAAPLTMEGAAVRAPLPVSGRRRTSTRTSS
jgi:hypothetical protein